jgi:molecular chaperone DnaK (HSP70)
VYDFGSVTTDLGLMEVRLHRDRMVTRIHVIPRDFRAHRFGGQDVTRYVAAYAWNRCLQHAKSAYPEERLVNSPLNQGRLDRWAEKVKIELGRRRGGFLDRWPVAKAGDPVYLALAMEAGRSTVLRAFPHLEIVPSVDAFEQWIMSEIASHASHFADLVKSAGGDYPDFILLSGRSGGMPVVAEAMRTLFPQSDLLVPGEPKESVVAGACIPYILSFSDEVMLQLDTSLSARLPSRVGYVSEDRFRPVFEAGLTVPETGVTIEREYPLRTGSRIRMVETANHSSDEVLDEKELGMYTPDFGAEPLPANGVERVTLQFHMSRSFEIGIQAVTAAGRSIGFVPSAQGDGL